MRRLAELTWPDLDACDRARTVILLPISPVEEHGPHLPLGTDIFVAQGIAERLAAEIERRRPDVECLLAPPLTLGSGLVPMVGSLGVSWRVILRVALAAGRTLGRQGFRHVVWVSGHGGPSHLAALELVALVLRRRYGPGFRTATAVIGRRLLTQAVVARLCDAVVPPVEREAIPLLTRLEHGGGLETSLMLALRPELVRPEYQALPPVPMRPYLAWRRLLPADFRGYTGEPARGRADVGAALVTEVGAGVAALIVDGIAAEIARVGARRDAPAVSGGASMGGVSMGRAVVGAATAGMLVLVGCAAAVHRWAGPR